MIPWPLEGTTGSKHLNKESLVLSGVEKKILKLYRVNFHQVIYSCVLIRVSQERPSSYCAQVDLYDSSIPT